MGILIPRRDAEVVKGISRQVIFVNSPETQLFEQAIFILKENTGGITDEMLLTHINAECIDADVYFPKFKDEEWDKELLEINKENDIEYSHVLYKRKNKEHL